MKCDKRRPILGCLFIILSIVCHEHCKEPTSTTTRPSPEEPTYYSIQIKYVRPPSSILQYKEVNSTPKVVSGGQCYWGKCSFSFKLDGKQIDDYNFNWSNAESVPDNETGEPYYLFAFDYARGETWESDTIAVGDIFYMRVIETGFEKQLTNIVYNDHVGGATAGPNNKMALWRLMKDGTIRDE